MMLVLPLALAARGGERYQCVAGTSSTIREVVLSPSGRDLAELMQSSEPRCAMQWIRVGDAGGGVHSWRTVLRGKGISMLHWVDDHRLAFVRGKRGNRISVEDIATGRVKVAIRSSGRIVSYSVDPSGKNIAYTYRIWAGGSDYVSKAVPDGVAVPWVVLPNWATVYKEFSGSGAQTTGIGVARIGDVSQAKKYVSHLNVHQLLWAANSDRAMMVRQASRNGIWQMSVIDLETGGTIVGPDQLAGISRVAVSPSGLLAVAASGPPDDRYSPAEPKRLYVIGRRREVHSVSAVKSRSVSNIWWEGDKTLWAEVRSEDEDGEPMVRRLLQIDWRRNQVLRTIAWPNGDLEGCQMDRRRTIAVCLAETLTASAQLIKIGLSSGAVTDLAWASEPVQRMNVAFREIRVRNRFGESTTGFLFLPARVRAVGPRSDAVPLVIMLYGFVREFARDGQWIQAYPVERLIQAGIAVLLLNVPEPTGWRLADPKAARLQLLEAPLATIDRAPKAVAASGLKISKMMVMGWSAGGLLAAQAIERSCDFVAAEVGDPAAWNTTGYALGNAAWRGFANAVFGGPPDERYARNYLAFDPSRSGRAPAGPILLEYVSRNMDAGQYLEEWRGTGAYVEAFAYHYSVHMLNVPAEAALSRERNLAWAKLNLLGPGSVSARTLRTLGLSVPPESSYRCGQEKRVSELRRLRRDTMSAGGEYRSMSEPILRRRGKRTRGNN